LKVLIPPGKSGNVLATIAIGEQYLQPFMKYAYHTWEMYCRRHDLGLILFDDHLISTDHPKFKNPFWQKLLIPKVLNESNLQINDVCHLDTDILINPYSPNIFDGHDSTKVGLISQMKRLPYDRYEVLRRVAFLRNRYLSSTYPLDSILFASIEQLFEFSNLESQPDYACTGVFIFSPKHHADVITNFFNEFDDSVVTPDSGGEELHFNYLIQSKKLDEWLDYRFQAIWIYEVAWKYQFLYEEKFRKDFELVRNCIQASLFANYFLHFAGPWHESLFWKQVSMFKDQESLSMFEDFAKYLEMPVTGKPKGSIKPKENS
jgi:hypothetical protein